MHGKLRHREQGSDLSREQVSVRAGNGIQVTWFPGLCSAPPFFLFSWLLFSSSQASVSSGLEEDGKKELMETCQTAPVPLVSHLPSHPAERGKEGPVHAQPLSSLPLPKRAAAQDLIFHFFTISFTRFVFSPSLLPITDGS